MRRAYSAVDAGFFLMVVLVPLAWTNVFAAEFTLAKFVTLNAALCLAAWGAALRPEALAAGPTAFDAPLLAGLFVACLSAAASSDPSTNLLGRYDSWAYGLWSLALLAGVVQLAARSARGRESVRAGWMIWTAAIVGGYGVLQKCGIDPVLHIHSLPGGRAVSLLGSPVDLGALLALVWPLSLWRLDSDRRPRSALAAILVAGGLIACGSRGAWLGAGAGAAAYWLMSRRRPGEALRPSLGVPLAAVAGGIAWSFRPGASVVDAARREVWKTALTAFVHHPWLGVGPDGFEDAFRRLRTANYAALMTAQHNQAYPHNDLLHVLASLGLLGAAVYAWLLGALAKAARRALEPETSRPLAAALAAGVLALWVNLEFNPVALEVLVFAAIASGLLVSLGFPAEAPSRLPRPLYLAAGALATISLFYALGLARADAEYKRAAAAQASGSFAAARPLFARARKAAPCELSYILAEVNSLGDWINASHEVDDRLSLLALAEADGREAVSCHPRQVNAHYISGAAARMHYDLGFKDQLGVAASEFDAALALDPMFEPLIAARRDVARFQSLTR
ncbi:MAG: O-antigen ligase family protein [Elusimicrobiota bacterium]